MKLSDKNIQYLESKGLNVEKVPFQDGYRILKPNNVKGNFIEGYELKLIGANL